MTDQLQVRGLAAVTVVFTWQYYFKGTKGMNATPLHLLGSKVLPSQESRVLPSLPGHKVSVTVW